MIQKHAGPPKVETRLADKGYKKGFPQEDTKLKRNKTCIKKPCKKWNRRPNQYLSRETQFVQKRSNYRTPRILISFFKRYTKFLN